MFKTRLRTFGNDFGHLWNFENFSTFWKHFEYSTLHGTLGKKIFFEKITPKHVQNTFGQFGNDFGHFWNFENFSFFKNISKTRPSMEHCAKKIFKKITSKHVQNTFGHFWERFWAFLNFENFWFYENVSKSRPYMEHWAKKTFRKKYPKTCSKHFWTILGTILGIFGNFEIFSIFWKHFEDSTLQGTLGKNFFSKILTHNMFKTRFDTFGNDLGIFATLKFFWFFENISKSRPCMEHWAKKNFRKNYPITCSKHVWTLFGTILSFFFWILKNFDFLKTFRRLDPPWNTGQKEISEEGTPKHVRNTFGQFGNDFVRFFKFENF